jgi:hypothetical protein
MCKLTLPNIGLDNTRGKNTRVNVSPGVNHHMKLFTFFIILILISSFAYAESAKGRFESIRGLSLNKATLEDVTKKLGKAKRFNVTEGHYEFAVCYEIANSKNIIIFSSSEEMIHIKEELLGFSVQSENSECFPCAKSKITEQQIHIDRIYLGMSETEFKAVLGGEITVVDNGDLVRYFDYERPLTKQELEKIAKGHNFPEIYDRPIADVSHSVSGAFKNGKLIRFRFLRFETN